MSEDTQDYDEEQKAASALGEILTSVLFRAYEEPSGPRLWLYIWEREGLQWLIRFDERRGRVGNFWIWSFIDLNRDAILQEDGRVDYNLRAARIKGQR